MSRTTTLAPGVVWVVPKDVKDAIPLKWRIAATELGKQFYRVNVVHWSGFLSFQLQVEVFRDKDTLNPNRYLVIVRNGTMYRKEDKIGGTLWPIYPEKAKQIPVEKPTRVRRPRRHAPQDTTVHEDDFTDNVHRVFCERAEIKDDMRVIERKFEYDPTVEYFLKLRALRKQLDEVEQRLVMIAQSERAARELVMV